MNAFRLSVPLRTATTFAALSLLAATSSGTLWPVSAAQASPLPQQGADSASGWAASGTAGMTPAQASESPTSSLVPSLPNVPELLRRDGVFCAQTNSDGPGCAFVMQITLLGRGAAWVTLTMLTRSEKRLPLVKIRLGHPAYIEKGEICIKPTLEDLRIEIFKAMDSRIGVHPDEQALDEEANRRARKIQKRMDGSPTCRALTRTGHLPTFGDPAQILRFVPLAQSAALRFRVN